MKNKWSYIYIPPMYLFGVDWEKFTLTYFTTVILLLGGAWVGVVVKALRY